LPIEAKPVFPTRKRPFFHQHTKGMQI